MIVNNCKRWLAATSLLCVSASALAQSVPNLAEQAAEEYRRMAKYPAWSQPLANEGVNPILSERVPAIVRDRGAGENGPQLAVWSDDILAQKGGSISVYARIDSGNLIAAPQSGDWALSAQLLNAPDSVLTEITLADNGRGADAIAGDGIYSASIDVADEWLPAMGQAQSVAVRVSANSDDYELRAMNGLLLSQPAAALTGDFRDAVVDGNLQIQAKVSVQQAGRFHLSAVLDTPLGEPAAFAQQSYELDAGEHWVALDVYGLILHELGAAVPLNVSAITLTTTQGMPNALGTVLTDVLTTAVRPLSAYTSKPFGRADLLDTAARLEAVAP